VSRVPRFANFTLWRLGTRDKIDMSSWFLYILECSDSSLYTGITTDLYQRIKRHNQGRACRYTSIRRPVKLVHEEAFENESLARRRELEIKKLSRENKLRLIKYSPSPLNAIKSGSG